MTATFNMKIHTATQDIELTDVRFCRKQSTTSLDSEYFSPEYVYRYITHPGTLCFTSGVDATFFAIPISQIQHVESIKVERPDD